jgi:hypothetical protein
MTGVDFTAKGETIDEEGQFDEAVYYSDKATANILSFASQIDEGAAIDYGKFTDDFTSQPANDKRINTFARVDL